jgi:hypothetical protein
MDSAAIRHLTHQTERAMLDRRAAEARQTTPRELTGATTRDRVLETLRRRLASRWLVRDTQIRLGFEPGEHSNCRHA